MQTVEMTFTYFKEADGSVTEVVKIAGKEIRRGPSPVFFIDTSASLPWEKEEHAGNRKSDEAATR